MARVYNELRNYQNIPRELVFDKTLSDRARFVYVFMASKPDDWEFFLEPMSREIGYSVDTLRKYINELVESGWLIKGEQKNEKGTFGAVDYIIKSTKNTDTVIFRHGNNQPQQNNNITTDNNNIISNKQSKEDNKEKELKEKFAEFVKLYKQLTKKNTRGVDTEFAEFSKRHKNWKEIVPYLSIAIERETKAREQARLSHKFFPEPKMLQTYLGKQKAWELYVTVGDDINAINNEYTPQAYNIALVNGEYLMTGMYFDGDPVLDGYEDDKRPNGATIKLHNSQGYIIWNATSKTWTRYR